MYTRYYPPFNHKPLISHPPRPLHAYESWFVVTFAGGDLVLTMMTRKLFTTACHFR